eukprot:s299_g15.t1
MLDPSFGDESCARERAMQLSMELVLQGILPSDGAFAATSTTRSSSSTRSKLTLHVGFAEELEFLVGAEDEWKMHRTRLPASSFAANLTPWSGCPRIALMHQRSLWKPYDQHGRIVQHHLHRPCSQPYVDARQMADSQASTYGMRQGRHDFSSLPSSNWYCDLDSFSTWTSSSIVPDEVLGNLHAVNVHDGRDSRPLSVSIMTFGPTQMRPDPNENPNFIDPPVFSDSSGSEGGPHRDRRLPLHHFPSWTSELWDILQEAGATELLEEGPVMYVGSYYVSHRTCRHQREHRALRLNSRYDTWLATVQDTWRDHIDASSPLEVHVVQPEPPISITSGIVAIVLVVQHSLPRHAAFLISAMLDGLERPEIQQSAHSSEIWTDANTIMRRGEVLHRCQIIERNGFGPCRLRVGRHQIARDRPVRIHDGLGVVIRVPMMIAEDEWEERVFERLREHHQHGQGAPFSDPTAASSDQTSLMARRPRPLRPSSSSSATRSSSTDTCTSSTSSSTLGSFSSWQRTVVFDLHGRTASVLVPWDDGDELLRRVAHAFALRPEEVLHIQHVGHRPDDLVSVDLQCLLLQRGDDLRPAQNMRLVLLDLEIYEDNDVLPGAFRRKSCWLPRIATWDTLFRLLGLDSLQAQYPDKCRVWINHDRIVRGVRPLYIAEGDYVKVFVGDEDCGFRQLRDSDTDDSMLLQTLPHRQGRLADSHHHSPRLVHCSTAVGQRARRHRRDRDDPDDDEERHRRLFEDLWARPHLRQPGLHNDPSMLFETWFLSGLNYPRCSTARMVALPADVAVWHDRLRQVWRDRVHPHFPIAVHHILPTPPRRHPGDRLGGHLLLLQHPGPEEAGVLFSNYAAIDTIVPEDRFAQIVPAALTWARMLWFNDWEHLCTEPTRHCLAYCGNRALSSEHAWRALPGQHLELYMHHHVSSDSDSMSLMQGTVSRRWTRSSRFVDAPAAALDIPEGGRRETQSFCFNPQAPAFDPTLPPLSAQSEFVQELHGLWMSTAFSWEDEVSSAQIVTYYANHHEPLRRCDHGRIVTLFENYADWEETIRQVWQDHLVPGLSNDFYVVTPLPPALEPGVTAYVILVQGEQDTLVTSLVTLLDRAGQLQGRSSVTTHELIYGPHLIHGLGLSTQCYGPNAPFNCWIWFHDQQVQLQQRIPGRNGYSFLLQMVPRLFWQASGPSLLQQRASLHRTSRETRVSERLTDSRMALNCRPLTPVQEDAASVSTVSAPVTLCLSDLLTRPVRLVAAHEMPPLPTYVECPLPVSEASLQQELHHWGHDCHVFQFGDHEVALCAHPAWFSTSDLHHYMFCHTDICDSNGTFLHSSAVVLTELQLMQFLYKLGYWRATILQVEPLETKLWRVTFTNVVVAALSTSLKPRIPKAWPQRPTRPSAKGPFFQLSNEVGDSACTLGLGLPVSELLAFFKSGDEVLCRDTTGHDFPESTKEVLCLSTSVTLDDFDRIVIYTDGSSDARKRHVPALRNDEEGNADTWAFVVLGERFMPEGSQIEVIGWLTHPVHYEPSSQYYLGAQDLGSFLAEREALTWAGLWRLSQNSRVDTIFRTDSHSSAQQAIGLIGSGLLDASFLAFRGVFQALESALPLGGLCVEHVPGHCGEAYNDMVDWLAQQERHRSFYCKRQRLSMQQWGPVLPHLWMFFSQNDGLPPLVAQGFCVDPPSLPAPLPDDVCDRAPLAITFKAFLGVCTANVNSMYCGEWGHAGKTAFLRQQFKSFGLNVMGLQETRTAEVCLCTDHTLRLASGSENGHYGVEFWVNLDAPYGYIGQQAQYFCTSDFQVLHRDPRTMLIRAETQHLSFLFLVGHAPHCGHPAEHRQAWWDAFSELAGRVRPDERLLVMLDANADPGDCDAAAVLTSGFKTTDGTHFLRSFLDTHGLCLPITSAHHHGDTTTWTSPDGSHLHSIDHVVISQSLLHECTHSSILDDFDLGNGHHDHSAVALQLAWQFSTFLKDLPQTSQSWRSTQRYAAEHVTAGDLQIVFQDFVPRDWMTDIATHVDDFNHHLRTGLHRVCGRPATHPKKPFITAEIWNLRTQKLTLRRRLRELHQRHRYELLRACFTGLCNAIEEHYVWRFREYEVWLQCCRVRLLCDFHRAARALRQHLRGARHGYLRERMDALSPDAPASTILHELRSIVGSTNLKKRFQKTLPYVRNSQGDVCQSASEALETWISFFQVMEGGDRLTQQQQHDEWCDHLDQLRAASLQLDVTAMPPLATLEAAFRRVKPGKATGPDGIEAVLCHRGPAMFARKTFSMLMKLLLHGQECLIHKGGRLAPIWKHKGPKDVCESFRSVLISSHVGKSLHRCLRSHTAELFESFLQRQQLGGKRKIPVTLGVHQSRAFLRSRLGRGQNVGFLFLDLCEAFYRIVRELSVGGPIPDEVIARMGHRLGMGSDLLHDLYQHLAEPSAIARANMPDHLQTMVRALHTDTHFHLSGQQDTCRTRLGTRPGDSWADLIFSFVWARILRDLEGDMLREGLLDVIPRDQGFRTSFLSSTLIEEVDPGQDPYLGPTWMDDSCFCFADADPDLLVRKAAQISSLVLSRCQQFAMTPNLKPGKTALMLVFQGRGARAARKRHFGPVASPGLPIVTETGIHTVQVVSSYVHLGSVIHHKGDTRREARRRISIATSAFQAHRKTLFQNRLLSVRKRAELFHTLVLSKFIYGCDSWLIPDINGRHHLHTSLMRLYRRLLPGSGDFAQTCSDDEVLARTGLPSPTDLLRMCRLRHLGALYACGQDTPWGLINADRDWCALVASDLQWMWTQLWHCSALQDPSTHFPAWSYLMTYHRGYWKRLIRRAGNHSSMQNANRFVVTSFHRGVLTRLHDVGALCLPPPANVIDLSNTEYFACMACEKRFKSRGGCGAHLFKVHGRIHPVRRLFDTTQCPCCLREFHSFGRLKTHLIRADFCRHSLQRRGHYVAPVSGYGSRPHFAQERTLDGLLPPLQAAGPHAQPGHRALEVPYDLVLYEQIYEQLLDVTDLTAGIYVIRQCSRQRAISWELFCLTLQALEDDASQEDIDALQISPADFHTILRHLRKPSAWSFLCDSVFSHEGHWHRDLDTLESYCVEEVARRPASPRPGEIPRTFGRVRYVLNVFAGRRRCGDIQFFFDKLSQAVPHLALYMISVDIVIDGKWGNVNDPEVRTFWMEAIRSRHVVGMIGGPPCETWSKAREIEIQLSHGRAPRVLRTGALPWGLASLSLRELQQVSVGNSLMGFQLEGIAELYCTGGAAILEHPAPPDKESSATIWRTPLMQFLLSLPG